MAKLPQDFADLLIELHEAGAEFLLVDGWAVILYGHVRATDDMAVEVLTKISGVTFDQALEDSKTFELDGYQIPYIGRAALIQNKKAAARHKDLADVEELERS